VGVKYLNLLGKVNIKIQMDCYFICKTSLLSPFLVKCLYFILHLFSIFIISLCRQDADTNIDRKKILLWPVPCTVVPFIH